LNYDPAAHPLRRFALIARKHLLAIAGASLVAGCGGGTDTGAARLDAPQPQHLAAQTTTLLPGTSVTPGEAAQQFLDFAEAHYSVFFPGHPATLTAGPFTFRAYPGGVFLVVVTADGTPFSYGGVYQIGLIGATLASPMYLGQLTSFMTPTSTNSGNGCFDLALLDTQGTHMVVNYAYSGTLTGNELVDTTVGGLTVFENSQARATTVVTTGSHGGVGVNTTTTYYGSRSGDTFVQFGFTSVGGGSAGGFNFTSNIRAAYSPPFVDKQYSLAVGGSVSATQTGSLSTDISFPGAPLPIPDTVTEDVIHNAITTTYVGQESVSVPAGTYNACKYQVTTNGDSATNWVIAGKGILVKTTTTAGLTVQATSVTLNGQQP
jgi:hypothetical protein